MANYVCPSFPALHYYLTHFEKKRKQKMALPIELSYLECLNYRVIRFPKNSNIAVRIIIIPDFYITKFFSSFLFFPFVCLKLYPTMLVPHFPPHIIIDDFVFGER